MKQPMFTLGLIFWSLISFSQYEHISFKSEFEKSVLTQMDKHSPIEWLLAISDEATPDKALHLNPHYSSQYRNESQKSNKIKGFGFSA